MPSPSFRNGISDGSFITSKAGCANAHAGVVVNGYLKRFGSVTVLNGHIHQVVKKVEGRMTFHTAMSTAFPQPEPGKAPKPGPMKVEAGKLNDFLGITDVKYVEGKSSLAVVDSTLS